MPIDESRSDVALSDDSGIYWAMPVASCSCQENPMSTTLISLGIDRLDVEAKLQLVQELWDSIAEEVE